MSFKLLLSLLLSLLCLSACTAQSPKQQVQIYDMGYAPARTAIFAGGCFWCVEAPLKMLHGVDTVISGYIGGHVKDPTYMQVTSGRTGHAEAVLITFNPALISYEQLLSAFFLVHNPTELNRQGNDIGTQYRSAIFPLDTLQEQVARRAIQQLNQSQAYDKPLATAIEYAQKFYVAEAYHQNYYQQNPSDAYCRLVIKPKMDLFKQVFAEQLAPNTP